jgi:Flp pilus assembly protein TadG
MRNDTLILGERKRTRESGSAMLEFVLTVPVLLMIAGTTVDMARYMRYLQITSFVSQEAASQIYRQCSDLTVYTKPRWGTVQVAPNTQQTIMAIERCLERVQIQSQRMLNTSLGRAAMNAKVFRWQIDQTAVTSNCAQPSDPTSPDPVTVISTDGNVSPAVTTTANDMQYLYQEKDTTTYSQVVNKNPVMIQSTNGGGIPTSPVNKFEESALIRSQVAYQDNSIKLTFPSDTGKPSRTLTTREGLCTRGRVATVEVGFVFDPVVKFLPNLVTNLETNALNREVSVF